jgi:hypothetical protein
VKSRLTLLIVVITPVVVYGVVALIGPNLQEDARYHGSTITAAIVQLRSIGG